MSNKKTLKTLALTSVLSAILLISGCSSINTESSTLISENASSESTTQTDLPSNDMDPDYDLVFNQTEVLEFHIAIDSEDWAIMQEDLAANVSTGKNNDKGVGGQRGRGAARVEASPGAAQDGAVVDGDTPVQAPPANDANTDRQEPPADGETTERPAAPTNDANRDKLATEVTTDADDYQPIWVESSISFNGLTWDHVGVRYKGNSSLNSAVSSGNNKLSFKLDFDEFEDEYPDTEDQRFYGFKQLNLNNNFSDASLMHEKIGADLFSEFGLASATTAFAVVYIDHGEGSQFYGVYALVEEMDDTGIGQDFDDDSGNLYKPDGDAASFAAGTYDDGQMEKKSNEDEGDYSDVIALYESLNSDNRLTDYATWKSDLEAVFNVDGFMKWLAANTVMQNWDTYGSMTHNYYLYNDPATGLLNWIPWDNNEAFTSGKRNSITSISMDEVSDDWPLIRYLMDDPDYKAIYDDYLQAFIDEVFTVEKMTATYSTYYDLLKEYAYAEVEGYSFLNSDSDFDKGVEALKTHVVERNEAVDSYLNN